MKKLVTILAVFLAVLQFGSSARAMTVDELEESVGIDISSANAGDLKTILTAFDSKMEETLKPMYQYRARIVARLRELGEDEWVTNHLGKNVWPEEVLGFSYDELIDLKNDINLAMWQSSEWQEVKVPQGTWKVGEDIPAGHWTVKCAPGVSYATIDWGESLSDNGQDISYWGKYSKNNSIYNPETYSNADRYMHTYEIKEVVRNNHDKTVEFIDVPEAQQYRESIRMKEA